MYKRLALSGMLLATGFLGLGPAEASAKGPNPTEDVGPAIVEAFGSEASLVSGIKILDENVVGKGEGARYSAGFSGEYKLPVASFVEISSGPGYAVVHQVAEAGDVFPIQGRVLGLLNNGSWHVRTETVDVQHPGGSPFSRFRAGDRVVLMADSKNLEDLLQARLQAQELTHKIELQEIESKAEQERAVEAAKRAAEQEAELALIAERAAADKAMAEIFTVGAEFPISLTIPGRRAEGVATVGRVAPALVEIKASFDTGFGGVYETPIVIQPSDETGKLAMQIPEVNDFRGGSLICKPTGSVNLHAGYARFTQETFNCTIDLSLEGLNGPASQSGS